MDRSAFKMRLEQNINRTPVIIYPAHDKANIKLYIFTSPPVSPRWGEEQSWV